jgi:hypothetical protein
MANPYLQSFLSLFKLLYRREAGELWYYDENEKFVLYTRQRRGVRQGCVLGVFLFCLTWNMFIRGFGPLWESRGRCTHIATIPISSRNRTRWLKS